MWSNNRHLFYTLTASLLTVLLLCTLTAASKSKCETCREIARRFKEGLDKTAKSNFGGGNTNWEEEKLGSFASSETRFLEVLEHVCDEGSKECHYMVEDQEEQLERWFFLHYARGIDLDLDVFLCIDKLKVCCPEGTYGAECVECTGGKEHPCSGNGLCQGSGTREGSGKCQCNTGYSGELCTQCSDGYFMDLKNDTHATCQACDRACNGSCSGAGRINCSGCNDGWIADDEAGCADVNECESEASPCSESEYCLNNDGSYSCLACDVACDGCTAAGAESCKACSTRHFVDGNACRKCHPSCAASCSDESSASCDACADGWRLADDGRTCVDIDECAERLRMCDKQSYCVNTEGSVHCSLCNKACDGCTGPTAADCVNCKSGFAAAADTDSAECTDIDECAGPTAVCFTTTEKCVNTVGSFRCDCADGFQRRSGRCEPKKKPSPIKKKEKTKPKPKPSDKQPQPDFSSSPLTKDLGEPLEGQPIDEMIVMEGSLKDTSTVAPPSKDSDTGNSRQDL